MIEPLSLKSEPNPNQEARTGGTISASQLITQFNLRSPTNARVCLSDRLPQSCKSTSSLKINNNAHYNFKRAKPKGDRTIDHSPTIKGILPCKTKHKIFEDIFQPQHSKLQVKREHSDLITTQDEEINLTKKQKNPKLTLPLHKLLHNK
jgi:hypothetical protein